MAVQALIKRVGERLADQGPFAHRVKIAIDGGFESPRGGDVTRLLDWIESTDHPGRYTFDIQHIDNNSEIYEFTFSDRDVAFEFKMRFA